MEDRIIFWVDNSKGEMLLERVESKKMLTNFLKDEVINNIVDYDLIKRVTNKVSNAKLTSENVSKIFSCIHIVDQALSEIEELLGYIKKLIRVACEKLMLENDWKELNRRIDNMIFEIDKITKDMVIDVEELLQEE